MRLLLIGLLLAGFYALGVSQMSELAIKELVRINDQYQSVAEASEQWSLGNTSLSLDGR